MMVYKTLPGGGYTAMPATEAKLARLQAQGWTLTRPSDPVVVPSSAPVATVVEAAPKKRGRPRRDAVN